MQFNAGFPRLGMNFPIKYANRNLQNINLANANFNLTVIFVSLFFLMTKAREMFQPDISTGGNRLNRYTLWDISSDLEYIYEWCFKKYSTQNVTEITLSS